jgi:hypothetical protein
MIGVVPGGETPIHDELAKFGTFDVQSLSLLKASDRPIDFKLSIVTPPTLAHSCCILQNANLSSTRACGLYCLEVTVAQLTVSRHTLSVDPLAKAMGCANYNIVASDNRS